MRAQFLRSHTRTLNVGLDFLQQGGRVGSNAWYETQVSNGL